MSADSDENEMDSYSDIEDADYYNTGLEDGDVEPFDPHKYDPEYFDYECYTVEEVKKLLSEAVEKVSDLLQLSPSLAKILLHENECCVDSIVNKYRDNAVNLLVGARIKPVTAKVGTFRSLMCPVCVMYQSVEKFFNLSCCHSFCRDLSSFSTRSSGTRTSHLGAMQPMPVEMP